MQEINLHVTGDVHAVSAANNLLAALIDNHLYCGNALGLDPRRISWRRALDMNDRALRQLVVGLGGMVAGYAREDGFDIAVASEVMAVLSLARDLADLKARLGRMIVGHRRDSSAVTAADLTADDAMAVLLRDALNPNLMQTLEGTPAFVHGGPFANIAHGCTSVIATRTALAHADIVVTVAGFGADLGAEKFLHIKCRQAGLAPDCVVIVATVRARKMHGGVAKAALGREDVATVRRGVANLLRHIDTMGLFGLPVAVALNRFDSDTEAERDAVHEAVAAAAAEARLCIQWSDGAAGAAEVAIAPVAAKRLARFEAAGFSHSPVCIAKTQYSFSADPTRLGAPEGHELPIREVRLAAGAGFVVALAGEVMTMPGLPRAPASETITLNAAGKIEGLF
jgi:formate--tetrahydrofolate ligase